MVGYERTDISVIRNVHRTDIHVVRSIKVKHVDLANVNNTRPTTCIKAMIIIGICIE